MILKDTQCCAVKEIHNLDAHEEGEAAMVAFCELSIVKPTKFHRVDGEDLYSFYWYSSPIYGTYDLRSSPGAKFTRFIKSHKLGTVYSPQAVVNWAFHPDHKNKMWIWQPNSRAVHSWWMQYCLTHRRK
jgi:hypothetical protein